MKIQNKNPKLQIEKANQKLKIEKNQKAKDKTKIKIKTKIEKIKANQRTIQKIVSEKDIYKEGSQNKQSALLKFYLEKVIETE